MNEVEYDIKNYEGQGLCYPPKLKAEVDNTNRGLDNSRYHVKTEFNYCFIIYSKSDANQLKAIFRRKNMLGGFGKLSIVLGLGNYSVQKKCYCTADDVSS